MEKTVSQWLNELRTADVKKAMKINYFDDKELIEEQVKRFSQE